MKTLYIHIGYHKTATTSLQQFLRKNEAQLAISGINYATSGRSGNSHAALANALKTERKNRNESKALWNVLIEEAKNSPCAATLISSECFLEQKSIPETLALFLDGKINLVLICYLRPQIDWVESVFSEVIKDAYRRYTGTIMSLREVKEGWLNYDAILQLWAAEFGYESLRVRPFQKTRMADQNVYTDFLSVLGISDLNFSVPQSRLNVSLHPSYVEFIRRCNMIPMLNSMHDDLVRSIEKIAQSQTIDLPPRLPGPSRLTESERTCIQDMIKESNEHLSEKFDDNSEPGKDTGFFADSEPVLSTEVNVNFLLSVALEHEIFNHLPAAMVSHFEEMAERVASRAEGKSFLPALPANEISRLRQIVMRQRIEARMMSEESSKPHRSLVQKFRNRISASLRNI